MENPTPETPRRAAEINATMRGAHVGLRTTDYAGTLQWYSDKLGFRVLQEWTVGNLRLAYLAPANDDSFWLEVVCDGASPAQPQPSPTQPLVAGFHHLCLAVDSVDDTLASLQARGVQVMREPFDVPVIGKRCGFVTDLHGNVLEFAEDIG